MNTAFSHIVHFWLKNDLTDAQHQTFLDEIKKLADSENVGSFRLGEPAGTPREVVDNSFSYQIIVGFDSKEAHDAYQSEDDAAHQRFIATCKNFWTKVVIYDSLPLA